jgi:lantibiotic biosynthesis protein
LFGYGCRCPGRLATTETAATSRGGEAGPGDHSLLNLPGVELTQRLPAQFVSSQGQATGLAADATIEAAGRNLGRFADLLGSEAEAMLRQAAHAEAAHAPDRLWAEISYLPHRFRSANVVIRPLVRDHEIVLGATPAQPFSETIPLDELVVAIRDARLSVRWPAADAEVVACAGHMLNTFQAPEVCRFLDDLRHDGLAQLSSFDWGPAAGFPFLPRVQTGRIVLAPAQWRIDHRTRASVLPSDLPEGFKEALGGWRSGWRVPRHVYLSVGDNRLLLDLEDAAQVEQLRAEVHRLQEGTHLVVHEALPAPDQAWAQGPKGVYITELVGPLVLRGARTRNSDKSSTQSVVAQAASPSSRLRPPGSDWLFTKLYCPRIFEDDLLTDPVPAFCEYVCSSGLAKEWFFVRYADPDVHLRL